MRYKRAKKQLVCAKGWYKVKGVLVYDLVTLGTTISGGKQVMLWTILYKEHHLRYNLLSAREGKFVIYKSSS